MRMTTKKPIDKPKWERKADERPGELLKAALEVFCRHGYRATRLDVVAEHAGVSKGTVYRYFENKEDLLEKALEQKVRQSIEETAEALEGFPGTPSEKLRFLLQRYWNRSQAPGWDRWLRLMFSEIAVELPALFQTWMQRGVAQGWALIEGVIRQGQQSGAFRKDADAKGIARYALSGLTYQAYLRAHIEPKKRDDFPPDRIFESAIDLIIAGLETRKPTEKKS
jgi:AcrR family transcriptional regulator